MIDKEHEEKYSLSNEEKRNHLKQSILEMLEEDPLMKYGEDDEVIYEIDDIKVYGGFSYGIRSIDHNVLKDKYIDWEEILSFGTVVVPEDQTYISNEKIDHYENLGFNQLPLDNNHIIKKTNREEFELER